MLKWIILALIISVLIGTLAVTIFVQREAPFRSDSLGAKGVKRALILYHPSRDAQFSDDLTLAIARGFEDAGLSVDRQTMTKDTPVKPRNYAIIAIVSNTFFWQPDWPTMRYLNRSDLNGVPTIGIMAGGGATERARQKLIKALVRSGADLRDTRSLWVSKPNDDMRLHENNRAVAGDIARSFAFNAARRVIAQGQVASQAGQPGSAISGVAIENGNTHASPLH